MNDSSPSENQSRGPLIVFSAVLFVLALYLGSYCALVTPPGKPGLFGRYDVYRAGEPWTNFLFYPLEQIDRRWRPKKWIAPRKE